MATVDTGNNLECSICCETFKTPKILICGHTFCLDCLVRYIGDKTAEFNCPVCAKVMGIPEGGAKMFTTNFVAHTTTATSPEPHVTGSTVSASSTTRVTSNTIQPSTTIKHRCPHHSDREVEFYCQTCEEGVCSRCIYLLHKDHESVDIDSDDTKEKAIEKVSDLENAIQQKIKDLVKTSTTLQEASERLYRLCEEECSKVKEYTEKMIAELQEKCEKTRSTIKTRFEECQQKLFQVKTEADNHVKSLQIDLETKLPSLTDDSCLTILQALPVMADLEKYSDKLTVSLPEITYLKWEEPCDLKHTYIGQLESRPLYLPKCNDFIFSIDDVKDSSVHYYSKNKYTTHGVVWSCVVQKTDDDKLGIYIALLPSDNPSIKSCDIDFNYTILNHGGKDSLVEYLKHCFTEEKWSWGRVTISWKKLTDKQYGYINEDNQFIVQFDITDIKDIKKKTR